MRCGVSAATKINYRPRQIINGKFLSSSPSFSLTSASGVKKQNEITRWRPLAVKFYRHFLLRLVKTSVIACRELSMEGERKNEREREHVAQHSSLFISVLPPTVQVLNMRHSAVKLEATFLCRIIIIARYRNVSVKMKLNETKGLTQSTAQQQTLFLFCAKWKGKEWEKRETKWEKEKKDTPGKICLQHFPLYFQF